MLTNATAEVQIGEACTLTGSVSGYTNKEQLVEDTTTDLYAMPKGALYRYGNECSDITGGWEYFLSEH